MPRGQPSAGGFVFPKTVAALIGPGTLTHFDTAMQLYGFISRAMPYHAPGSLTSDQYWDLTAFLLSAHEVKFRGTLSAATASVIRLRPEEPLSRSEWATLAAIVGIGVFTGMWMLWRHRRLARMRPQDH